MSETIKVAVIGCGLIGERRIQVIRDTGLGQVVGVYDPDADRARKVGERIYATAEEAIASPESNTVVIATPNHLLAQYGRDALRMGKNVLVEKPGAIDRDQILGMRRVAGTAVAKVGYNHRFHP